MHYARELLTSKLLLLTGEDFPRRRLFHSQAVRFHLYFFRTLRIARVGERIDSIFPSLKCFDIHPSIHGYGFIILSDHEEAHA